MIITQVCDCESLAICEAQQLVKPGDNPLNFAISLRILHYSGGLIWFHKLFGLFGIMKTPSGMRDTDMSDIIVVTAGFECAIISKRVSVPERKAILAIFYIAIF